MICYVSKTLRSLDLSKAGGAGNEDSVLVLHIELRRREGDMCQDGGIGAEGQLALWTDVGCEFPHICHVGLGIIGLHRSTRHAQHCHDFIITRA